jgi:hypothetical protein
MNASDSRLPGLLRGAVSALGACLALVSGWLPSTPTAHARPADDRREPSIEQRVEALRRRYLSDPIAVDTEASPAARRPARLTQWFNWPNWPNSWGNWQNWRNS